MKKIISLMVGVMFASVAMADKIDSVQVSASIMPTCKVEVENVLFGEWNPLDSIEVLFKIQTRCNNRVNYSLETTRTASLKFLKNQKNPDYLRYQIYKKSNETAWDEFGNLPEQKITGVATGSIVIHDMKARLLNTFSNSDIKRVSADVYTDDFDVSIVY